MKPFTILYFFLFMFIHSQAMDKNELRLLFTKAVDDEEICIQLHDKLVKENSQNPLDKAYLATAKALMAKHHWNPIKKMDYLGEYSKMMKAASKEDINNLEIRYLRLSVEVNIPSFLNMSKNVQNDKNFIMKELMNAHHLEISQEVIEIIVGFIATTGLCSQEDIQKIKQKFSIS